MLSRLTTCLIDSFKSSLSFAASYSDSASDSYAKGKSRVNVSVRAESRKAMAENSEHNTILKAVIGG